MQVEQVWQAIESVRQQAPLVHNITNFVVMNNTANGLLALGASPVMAHACEEVADMAGIASALVINIGTLSKEWIKSMEVAMKTAGAKGTPIVFDPVGAGATEFRTRTCKNLLELTAPTIIRGNASEIMAVAGSAVKTKGVDSSAASSAAEAAATEVAKAYGCSVVVSGEVDFITDGRVIYKVKNGHPLMPRVTGLGCTATAIVGAFAAVSQDAVVAATAAMVTMGICGEIAAAQAAGPGSFQVHFLDALYNLNREQLEAHWQDCEL